MFVVKKNSDMINKTFRLPLDLVTRLDVVAKSQSVSLNNLVQQCGYYALNDMKDVDDQNCLSKKK